MSRTLSSLSRDTARALRTPAKCTAIGLLRLRHRWRQRPGEFVFVNSAARSGSTLLSNILCNHPQICGYGETKTVYRSSADLSRLAGKAYWSNRQWRVRERYVLEKIVLGRLLPNPEALNDAAISWIFLLRDPVAVINSYVEYFKKQDETRALDHYERRFKRLQSDARHYTSQGHRALFLTYEQLTTEPQSTLHCLTDFLALPGDLKSSYTRPRAHEADTGDQSERIKTGQIIAEPRRYRIPLSATTLERARATHAECATVLRGHCQVVARPTRSDRDASPLQSRRVIAAADAQAASSAHIVTSLFPNPRRSSAPPRD